MERARFEELLKVLQKAPLLWDGAMGTQLQARGLEVGDAPERLNATRPDIVREIHREYFDAGADGVETNTFGGSRLALVRFGLGDETAALNRRGAELAAAERPKGKWVAGSIGPTSRIPEPYGDCSLAEIYDAFSEQAAALRSGGVDFFLVETMIDILEACEAVRACVREGGLPVVASATFNKVPMGFRTTMGSSPEETSAALLHAGAGALGTNCSNSMDVMSAITAELRRINPGVPLFVMPNAGLPQRIQGRFEYLETPEKMAARAGELIEKGANVLGGCCGTTPAHIRAFRRKLDAGRAESRAPVL